MEVGPARKRGAGDFARRRAAAISARINRKYPYGDYGRAYLKRGSPLSLQYFGPSYKAASDAQKRLRKELSFVGRGKYRPSALGSLISGMRPTVGTAAASYAIRKGYDLMTGKGGYIGRTLGKLGGSLAGVAAASLPVFVSGGTLAPAAGLLVPGLSAAGAEAGDQLEDYLKSKFSRWTGRGEYVTNDLVSSAGAKQNVVPDFHPSDITTVTLSNREYLRDIFAPLDGLQFSLQSFNINPGLKSVFPWLAQIAANYEEYEFKQLIFTYKSTVADFAAASGQVGQVMIATQYNPQSQDFATKEEMMLYDGSMSCKTSESMLHGVECDPSKNSGSAGKYVRIAPPDIGDDLKDFDLGKLSVAVMNCPSAYNGQQLGELWVSYTIELRKPKLVTDLNYACARKLWVVPNSNAQNCPYFLGTVVGNQAAVTARSALPVTFEPQYSTTSSLTIPQGAGTDWLDQSVPTTWTPATSIIYAGFLRFDPSYEGIVRIRCVIARNAVWGASNRIVMVGTGNGIKRFQDIPFESYAGGNTWSHVINTYSDDVATSTKYTLDMEIHLRISKATGGIPNTIWIGQNDMPNVSTMGAYLEIQEYNTNLSVEDNDSNDRLLMINNKTGVPIYF